MAKSKSKATHSDLYRKYLDPTIVAQLSGLELKARLVVEGFVSGLHKSPHHGFNVEFTQHRQYEPGDEIKNIDWRVFARSDRYYIKQYEEETNLKTYLLIDTSASMRYSSGGGVCKYEYATYLAAALAYLLLKQQDAVGLGLFNQELEKYLPPRSNPTHLREIFTILSAVQPAMQTDIAAVFHALAERFQRRGLVVIFSDLMDDPAIVIPALQHFRHKKHEVLLFHILDPVEIELPFREHTRFVDMENGEEILTHPEAIREDYQKRINAYIDNYKRRCGQARIDYHLINTSTPFDYALRDYLRKRAQINI